MNRLTFDGNFCEIAQCRELPCTHGGSCTQRKVWEKLKAYEDLGLEPEDYKCTLNVEALSESVRDGYVSAPDLIRVLREEYEIDIVGG